MLIEIRVPEAGESITQVELARWLVKHGQYIEKDQEIAEIDSDKATLTINAEQAGIISISLEEGSNTEPGKIIGTIDTSAEKPTTDSQDTATSDKNTDGRDASGKDASGKDASGKDASGGDVSGVDSAKKDTHQPDEKAFTLSPQAKRTLEEAGIHSELITDNPDSKRLTKKDILSAIAGEYHKQIQQVQGRQQGESKEIPPAVPDGWGGNRLEERHKMSTLRRKIAERLVAVKNQTAMLTTFNEVDMSAVIALRAKSQDAFIKKYGIKLGFMSFFAKAVAESIPFYPGINGFIDGNQIVIPSYADIGIAVSTAKGLMVPVIRNAEVLSIAALESKIQEMAAKARDGKISPEDLKGGTISITNGGIFGSMLSTPIINPPQSAILGMHNIIERPVAVNGQVEIRPMMYLALSYDHRVVDGRESVGFLVKIKEMIENPGLMALHGKSAEDILLGL